MKKITDIVWELAEPAVQEQGCRIWDVEYVREAGQWRARRSRNGCARWSADIRKPPAGRWISPS